MTPEQGTTRRDWKAEAIRQWDAEPCGADQTSEFASPEFFARVARERYDNYAPWLPAVIGFDRYAGRRVLEVGFGLGTDHVSFARAGARCYGTDLTSAHATATRRRLQQEGFPVRLTRGDAETLPFRDSCFDVVYSFGVLHHTPETRKAVEEIHRVLHPGGEAIVALYHRDSVFFWVACVLVKGLLKGGFLTDGYRRTLSQIERREHSDAVPLVRVYGRRGARRLFRGFDHVQIAVHHFDFDHAGRAGRILRSLFRRWEPQIARLVGWYLVVRARKAARHPRGAE